MRIEKQKQSFKGITPYSITSALESNTLLNKALFDLTGSDIPWIIMANNKDERRERINRGALSVAMVFVSPLVALPFVNRFAMRYVSKLTPKMFSKEYNAVKLSNKYLGSAEKTKEGLKELSKELKMDFSPVVKRVGGDYDKLRKKIITSKNIVLGFDLLMVAGVFGHIGFYNNLQTKKKTGRIGFSAELNMADKSVIEKRAKKQDDIMKFKYAGFLGVLGAVSVALPIAIKKGLSSSANTKFANYIKQHAHNFDYKNAIFMARLPMALSFIAAHSGIFLASRNESEMKDNAIRSTSSISIFFLIDLISSSILGQLSDKIFKTNLIKREGSKNILTRILPPVKSLKELSVNGNVKTKNAATGIFWFNFASLSALMGFGVPAMINKIVKKDVSKDANKELNK